MVIHARNDVDGIDQRFKDADDQIKSLRTRVDAMRKQVDASNTEKERNGQKNFTRIESDDVSLGESHLRVSVGVAWSHSPSW